MAQIAYDYNLTNAFVGTLGDVGPNTVRSYAAAEKIPFGLALMRGTADASKVRLPFVGQVVLTESTALVAANSTAGTVNVTTLQNGVPTTVSTNIGPVVFNNTDAATLTALAAAIAAVAGVKSATAGNGNITVVANPDASVTLSNFVTTGGAGQPTWSYADTSNDLFAGVALFDQGVENALITTSTPIAAQQAPTSTQYPVGWAVSTLTRGTVNVAPETAVNLGDPVFIRFASGANGSQPGAFGNTSDGATCVQITRARWVNPIANGAVGLLEVSLP